MTPELNKYHYAHEKMRLAQQRLLEATRMAWPKGMQVISNTLCDDPIACTVVCQYEGSGDVGSLLLRSNRTGKTHQAWPHSHHNGVWGVVPA